MAPGPEDGLAAPSPGGESVMSGTGGGDGDGAGGAGHKREASGTPADDLAGRKKKKTGPGSRGVANLTPDQLAKKRANGKSMIPLSLLVISLSCALCGSRTLGIQPHVLEQWGICVFFVWVFISWHIPCMSHSPYIAKKTSQASVY